MLTIFNCTVFENPQVDLLQSQHQSRLLDSTHRTARKSSTSSCATHIEISKYPPEKGLKLDPRSLSNLLITQLARYASALSEKPKFVLKDIELQFGKMFAYHSSRAPLRSSRVPLLIQINELVQTLKTTEDRFSPRMWQVTHTTYGIGRKISVVLTTHEFNQHNFKPR